MAQVRRGPWFAITLRLVGSLPRALLPMAVVSKNPGAAFLAPFLPAFPCCFCSERLRRPPHRLIMRPPTFLPLAAAERKTQETAPTQAEALAELLGELDVAEGTSTAVVATDVATHQSAMMMAMRMSFHAAESPLFSVRQHSALLQVRKRSITTHDDIGQHSALLPTSDCPIAASAGRQRNTLLAPALPTQCGRARPDAHPCRLPQCPMDNFEVDTLHVPPSALSVVTQSHASLVSGPWALRLLFVGDCPAAPVPLFR